VNPDSGLGELFVQRWRALDGLRAVAILMVFVGHVRGTPLPGGFVGVEVFFVLSGFLITGLLLREHERHGSVSLRAFFARRVLRLYPALVLLCVVALPMAAVAHGYDVRSTGIGLLSALAYCFNIVGQWRHTPSMVGNLWSLSVEEQYYILWAPAAALLLARVGSGRRAGAALAGLVAGGWLMLVGTVLLFGRHGLGVVYFQLPGHVTELAAGGLLAWVVFRGVPDRLTALLRSDAVVVAAAAALLLALRLESRVDGLEMLVVYPGLALAAAAMIGHVVVAPQSWASRLLSTPVVVWLGRRSYAFYLFHRAVLHLVDEHVSSRAEGALLAFVTSVLLAELSWRLVEQPALARKRRFTRAPAEDDAVLPQAA
jgi:peptidoglycan/LPS O-acetylase OafA/YrhL